MNIAATNSFHNLNNIIPTQHSYPTKDSSNNINKKNSNSTDSSASLSYQITFNKNTNLLSHASKIASKIGLSLQQNWKILLLYILIWTIIIVSYGAMYGFETVGLPLAIGLGVGFGIGIISGIIVALKIDKTNKWAGKNTLWNLVTHYMWDLDEYGTRQILIATIITVVSAAFTTSPYAIGAVIGLLLGNHILTKICYHLREIPTPLSHEKKLLLEKKDKKKITHLKNKLKMEFLIRNNLLIKKQLLNIKATNNVRKTSNLYSKKRIFITPTRRSHKRKKICAKRILTIQNKNILNLKRKIKCNETNIRLLSKKLLQLDNTVNITNIESAFKI